MATKREEAIVSLTQELKATKAELAKAQAEAETLRKENELLNPKDITEDEKKILELLGRKEEGYRFHQLEADSGFSTVKMLHLKARLEKKGYVLQHGGEGTTRLKLDKPGLDYALRNSLI